MEEVLVAVLKGGELIADCVATVYERVSTDEADAEQQDQPQ